MKNKNILWEKNIYEKWSVFSTFSQKVTPKMPCNFTSFINKLLYVSKMCSHDDIPNAFLQVNNALD